MRRFLPLSLILVGLTACAPWVNVGGYYEATRHNFTVDLPEGWMRLNTPKYVLVTRDGVLLQNIVIRRWQCDEKLQHTKKEFRKDMLPQEVAEVLLDDTSSDPAVLNFALIENLPAEAKAFLGSRIVFTFKNKDGLQMKSVCYAFMQGNWVYSIRYTAPVRHYFDKDIETFEKMVQTFKLIGRA